MIPAPEARLLLLLLFHFEQLKRERRRVWCPKSSGRRCKSSIENLDVFFCEVLDLSFPSLSSSIFSSSLFSGALSAVVSTPNSRRLGQGVDASFSTCSSLCIGPADLLVFLSEELFKLADFTVPPLVCPPALWSLSSHQERLSTSPSPLSEHGGSDKEGRSLSLNPSLAPLFLHFSPGNCGCIVSFLDHRVFHPISSVSVVLTGEQ